MIRSRLTALFSLAVASVALAAEPPAFTVRPGYKVTVAASDFGQARFMEFGDDGTLYVSQPQQGSVTALKDKDGDGVYETKAKFLSGYKDCHGMVFDNGWLYVSSTIDGSVKRAKSTKGDGVADVVETFLPPDSLPRGGGHPFIGLVFTKEHLYASSSDPSNMLEELPSKRKSIWRFDRDGKNPYQFSTGVRNTEKLRLRPGTEEVWGVDHGSDNFGKTYGEGRGNQPITDQLPGEELNYFTDGAFYGHPFISNNRIVRPEYAKRSDIVDLAAKTTAPAWVFGAHWAGNGFTFVTKPTVTGHAGDLIAAFHGSWNSTTKVGYCVTQVLFDDVTGKPYGTLQLVSGLSADGRDVLGRPVDCVEAPDGSVLFSCDKTNAVYRLTKDANAK
jgi:glucose/arabinose dehydrogenase